MPTPKTANLTAALCEFAVKVAPIHKDAKGQHSQYASIQAVLAAVTPALAECGLAVTQTFTTDCNSRPLLVTTLRHTGGESVTSTVPLVTGGNPRNPLHDWGGAVTYQRRYALLAILNLAAGIEDDDGDIASSRMTKAASSDTDEFI